MAFVLVALCLFYTALSSHIIELSIDSAWIKHKREHGLEFGAQEEKERMEIFSENLRFIQDFNSKKKGFTLGMNKLGHLRASEISFGLNMTKHHRTPQIAPNVATQKTANKSKDWRNDGVISRVKDQGACGSCYAFSAVGAIEAHHAIKFGDLKEYSEQEVVDCSTESPNNGCDGGMPDSVFEYSMKHGMSLEKDYAYHGQVGSCKARSKKHSSKVLSYVDLPSSNEQALVNVLSSIGPVSVGIDANHQEFRFYQSGVLDIEDCSKTNLDHGVLAVGFNAEADPPYLIVKNSWGTSWGEDGYFRLALYKNMCGVSSMASYPIIKDES